MTISVILAVFNEDLYLGLCLKSLLRQNGIEYEVLVVDDGSTKPVASQTYPVAWGKEFKLLCIKHSGTAVARNYGAEHATGKILVFVDGDMTFEPDFLAKLTEPIFKGKAKGTFSTQESVANWDNPWARSWSYENSMYSRERVDIRRADMSRDFRAILKTEFDRVKGFEDVGYTDTWTLSSKLGYAPVPTKATYYHYNPASSHEAFAQALWIGARTRKGGVIGKILALLRATLPFSILVGVYRSLRIGEWFYLQFKFIYDIGILWGIIFSFRGRKIK